MLVDGDLFTQAAKTIELLTTKYLKAAISYQGIQRIESLPVPEPALREAVLNAIIYRDYAVGAPIQIRVYPDRLAIRNPGELPEGWSMSIINACRDVGAPEPRIEFDARDVWVTFPFPSEYLAIVPATSEVRDGGTRPESGKKTSVETPVKTPVQNQPRTQSTHQFGVFGRMRSFVTGPSFQV